MSKLNSTLALPLALAIFAVGTQAALPPSAPPVTIDATLPNLFYGAIPPTGPHAPVVVFVHGIQGTYQDWLEVRNCPVSVTSCKGTSNDMYDLAYQAGFRTAFMSLSADNSPNQATIQTNGAMLQTMFPKILATFNVTKVYFVAHSKGGLDLQAAIATPQWLGIANAVDSHGVLQAGEGPLSTPVGAPPDNGKGGCSVHVLQGRRLPLPWESIHDGGGQADRERRA